MCAKNWCPSNHSTYTISIQWLHALLSSLRMLSVYFLLVQLGFGTPFCFILIMLSFVARTSYNKLNLSIGYMTIHNVYVSQLSAFQNYGHPLVRTPDRGYVHIHHAGKCRE